MVASDVTRILRPGLLDGVALLVAIESLAAEGTLGTAVADACIELGGTALKFEAHPDDEATVDAAVRAVGRINMLVVDSAALFAGGLAVDGQAGITAHHTALRTCLDASWNVTRAAINHAWLPSKRGGRVIYLAPARDAGELAEAARAGLENLARTLSIEWARHGVNVLCIAPGADTTAGEVAALCAYLASPAGAYFSGCLLDLRGPV